MMQPNIPIEGSSRIENLKGPIYMDVYNGRFPSGYESYKYKEMGEQETKLRQKYIMEKTSSAPAYIVFFTECMAVLEASPTDEELFSIYSMLLNAFKLGRFEGAKEMEPPVVRQYMIQQAATLLNTGGEGIQGTITMLNGMIETEEEKIKLLEMNMESDLETEFTRIGVVRDANDTITGGQA